jgi:hypothetical protein
VVPVTRETKVAAGGKVDGVFVGRTRGLLFGVLAVLVLIVAGCGGNGDQLTTEEFFLEVGVLDQVYTAANDDLEAKFDEAWEAAASEEEVVEAFAVYTEDGVVVLEDFVNGFEQLNAPDGLRDFQDRSVTAGRQAIDTMNELVTALDDVTTEAGLIDSYEPVGEEFERFNAICFEAQGRADDAGVDVAYDCGD